jgi:WD40 repeat protein
MCGQVTGASMEELKKLLPKRKLLIFVSSTFLDTNLERNILHRNILPDLQRRAQQHDIQITFYDMRFGVKDENTLDHMTWETCKDAIVQCHEGSDGMFFLSLQADRYGYLPLPKYLNENIIQKVREENETNQNFLEAKKILEEWYILDDNHCPPRYELRTLSSLDDSEYWQTVLPTLRDTLLSLVPFEHLENLPGEELRINHSVTEWETLFALNRDKKRCYWLQRSFDKDTLQAFSINPSYWKFTDIFAQSSTLPKLESLRMKMKTYLEEEQRLKLVFQLSSRDIQRLELVFQLRSEAYFEKGTISCDNYLNEWEQVLRGRLDQELNTVIDKVKSWQSEKNIIPIYYLEEVIHHCSMAFTKANSFYGREDLLETAMKHIVSRFSEDLTSEVAFKMRNASSEFCEILEPSEKLKRVSWISRLANSIRNRFTKVRARLGKTKNAHDSTEGISEKVGTTEEAFNKVNESVEFPTELQKSMETSSEKACPQSSCLSGIDVALIGKSGCGKTALMAKLALSYASMNRTIPTIIRFCGTSTFSLNGLKLIQSICIQLLAAYGELQALESYLGSLLSQDYETAVVLFHRFMADWPVFLYIDSLDQLENQNQERSKLSFLRDIRPHEQSRIIVSTLPDEYNEDGTPGKYFYQCERTLKDALVPVINVGIMDEIEIIITSLLISRNRKLTSDQWMVTMQAVSHEPTILYINLAMEVISQWRSFEKEVILTPTVKGLIHQIFGDLELSYGKQFTSIAFAMITFSRDGVNDSELKDLLSLHERVMTEVCQYSKLHCFPMHAWLRLKQVISNLVTEKENHCIKWYHRQLWETASERYSEKEKECHETMGKYFANRVDIDLKKEKDIMDQPLMLNEVPVWLSESIVNRRRVVEGYYHLIKGGLLQEAAEEVCSLEFVCCSALAGDLSNCIRYVGELVRLLGDNEQLDHYYRWMKKKVARVVRDPRRQTRMTAGEEPLISVVKQQISQLNEEERNELGATLGPVTFGCGEDFDTLELVLTGHTGWVYSVAWNHDDSKIVSGSGDKTIKIWDGITGELLNTLEGHFGNVTSVSWNHDSSKILSSCDGGTIEIWDGITCELLLILKDGYHFFYSVLWNHDSTKIACGSVDHIVRIWDAITGVVLHRLSGHTNSTRCVSWNHDDSKLLSGSDDKTIKIWNTSSGELLKTLEGHSDYVTSASLNHESSRIVSGSKDKTIKIWDGMTGELLKTLEGHSSEVYSVTWNHDSSRILSGSLDHTVKIWNAFSGELQETAVEATIWAVDWSHDERRIVAGGLDGPVRVWTGWGKHKGKKTMTLSGITLSDWNPVDCKRIALVFESETIQIWDGMSGEPLQSWKGHSGGRINSLTWNHDGTKLASGSGDGTVRIWDGVTYELLMTLEGHSGLIHNVTWNHDSSRILCSSRIADEKKGAELVLWDGVTGEKLKTVIHLWDSYPAMFWNHNSSKLLIGSMTYGVIHVWDGGTLTEERELCRCENVSSMLRAISWKHDASQVISSSSSSMSNATEDKTIQIWDAESGALLNTLTGHSDIVNSVFWNQDDSKIFSGSLDGTIRIWDGITGQLLKIESVGCRITWMSLTRSGDRIAFTCEEDPFVRCLSVTNFELLNSRHQEIKFKIPNK